MTPRHVAVLLDGHAQFAEEQGVSEAMAYRAGCAKQLEIARWCHARGADTVTLEILPPTRTDPHEDIAADAEWAAVLDDFLVGWDGARDIALNHLGDPARLPVKLADRFRASAARRDAATQGSFQVNLALGYDGHGEILDAVRATLHRAQADGRGLTDVAAALDVESLETQLASGPLPPVDLIIRAGGGQYLSGFLLWQSAYAEFYFSGTPAPALTQDDLAAAFADYARRNRRYGK
ncbi:undecaprenyl diphosphate synthase family protein [Streptomyces parvus]|uniref:undecaprenyl diphosphate synthase family protein n=1 Tax=Streptomyces parvus TaxID=66428 RepID=UPI003D7488A1